MASPSRIGQAMTLEEFLELPDIDEPPYLEFIDGRIEAKVSPQKKHSRLATRLITHLSQFAEPAGLGSAFVELRCTFAGRSIVPDVVFLLAEHILADQAGEIADETPCPPDIHVEIISPKQGMGQAAEKLLHSTAHGCPLGWLIHPYRKRVDVYRPGRPVEHLASDGVLEGEPVLPGFRLPVAEIFGWLIYRRPEPGAETA
jgi:Uma2 family endonuclease